MISVCIASHNGGKYIAEQVNSILAQLGESDEIIISDDGSSDNTISVIYSICDRRIRVVKCPPIGYQTSTNPIFRTMQLISCNFENALRYARGDIILLSDQDDIWLPDKIKKTISHLDRNNCVIHDCYVVDSNLDIISDTFFEYIKPRNSVWGTLFRSSFMGCCMAFKREILLRCLPFPKFPIEHDTWIGLNALKNGNVEFIKEPLIYYRRHLDNVSSCSEGSKNSLRDKMLRRFYIFKAILKTGNHR